MRSERATYLDIGSTAETEAGRGSGAEELRGAVWSLSRPALVVSVALALACGTAAAAVVWTSLWGPPQNGAGESSGRSLFFANGRTLGDQGTLVTEDVGAGSQFVAVHNSNIFKVGDDIILLDNSVEPEVSEEGRVVLVEAPDTLVLQDPLSHPYPRDSVAILPSSATSVPTSAPTAAPTSAPTPAPTDEIRPASVPATALGGDAYASGGAVDTSQNLWGQASPAFMPPPPPPPSSDVVAPLPPLSRNVVAPTPPLSSSRVVVIDDGGQRGGGATVSEEGQHNAHSWVGLLAAQKKLKHKAAQEESMGGLGLFSVIFAAVVCCMGCLLVSVYFTRPQSATFTDWVVGFPEWARGKISEELARGQGLSSAIFTGPGASGLIVESNQGFNRGDKLTIKSDVANEVNFVHSVEGADVIILAEALQHNHPPGTVILSQTSSTFLQRRDSLVTELFYRLDTNGNQLLDASELWVLAKHIGYPGSRTDWDDTYSRLAKMCFEDNEEQGCSLMQFKNLIANRSSSGFYVPDGDIMSFLGVEYMDA